MHPRGELGQQLFAFMTLAPGHSTTVARLHGQAQDCLPDYMLPTLRIVEALPLMGNGKLDRKTLQQWADKVLDTVGNALPRTPLEALLADVWAQVLGLERVGIDDDFFELGGHSLAAVTLASRLQTALSAPVTVNAVFNAPSVSAFAALVQAELKPRRWSGCRRPTPLRPPTCSASTHPPVTCRITARYWRRFRAGICGACRRRT